MCATMEKLRMWEISMRLRGIRSFYSADLFSFEETASEPVVSKGVRAGASPDGLRDADAKRRLLLRPNGWSKRYMRPRKNSKVSFKPSSRDTDGCQPRIRPASELSITLRRCSPGIGG